MLQNIQNNVSNNRHYTNSYPSQSANNGYASGSYSAPSNRNLGSVYQMLNQLVSQLNSGSYQRGHSNQNQQGANQPNTFNYYQQQSRPGYQQSAQQPFQLNPYNQQSQAKPSFQSPMMHPAQQFMQNQQNQTYTKPGAQPFTSQHNTPQSGAQPNPFSSMQNNRPAETPFAAQQSMGQPGSNLGQLGPAGNTMGQLGPVGNPTPFTAQNPGQPMGELTLNPNQQNTPFGAQQGTLGFRPNMDQVNLVHVPQTSGFNDAFAGYDRQKDLRSQVQAFSQQAGNGMGTGTGLDHIVSYILSDEGLGNKAKDNNVEGGAYAANALNHLFVKAAQAIGADQDGQFTPDELKQISQLVQKDYNDLYIGLHGDDEAGEETGFHLVQNNGGKTQLNLDGTKRNAVNTVFDGFYHFGFDINDNGRYLNEDGNANQKVEDVAAWLNDLYFQTPDQAKGHAEAIAAYGQNNSFDGAFNSFNGLQTHKAAELQDALAKYSMAAANGQQTGTGLDTIVNTILSDEGLQDKISNVDRRGGAYAANGLNHLFNDVANAIGATADGKFTEVEIETVNEIISQQFPEVFVQLHGNDENKEETGYHLVQNDGAKTTLDLDGTNRNAVNTIYDGFYHYGFETEKGRFLNEDGNANQKVSDVTNWLNAIYFDKQQDAAAQA